MMSIIGNQPVMWVNAITLASAPQYYGETGMQAWNHDLLSACHKYPTMRVYDWAANAKPAWFIPDGIHYTQDGYIARTRLIAHALARCFSDTPTAERKLPGPVIRSRPRLQGELCHSTGIETVASGCES